MILKQIKKGDRVRLFKQFRRKEDEILTVTDVKVEKVMIRKSWIVDFVRVYFGKEHNPVYSWKIKEIIEDENNDR